MEEKQKPKRLGMKNYYEDREEAEAEDEPILPEDVFASLTQLYFEESWRRINIQLQEMHKEQMIAINKNAEMLATIQKNR